jgi:hypothetical protein
VHINIVVPLIFAPRSVFSNNNQAIRLRAIHLRWSSGHDFRLSSKDLLQARETGVRFPVGESFFLLLSLSLSFCGCGVSIYIYIYIAQCGERLLLVFWIFVNFVGCLRTRTMFLPLDCDCNCLLTLLDLQIYCAGLTISIRTCWWGPGASARHSNFNQYKLSTALMARARAWGYTSVPLLQLIQ